jgi:phosphate starvation-inducible protein PhoH
MHQGIIEVAPIAFMRGRTLNDAFIILDEAQNTTSEQMKMFLTRIGFNSKAVITGDITQIDLPTDRPSGLVQAKNILKGIKGIRFVFFQRSMSSGTGSSRISSKPTRTWKTVKSNPRSTVLSESDTFNQICR